MRRRTVDDWRTAVFRAARVSGNVQVLLLYLSEHMKGDRHVSVPRHKIATALDISERRVSDRISAAHAAGFLSTVSSGYRGHVAVYQGTFPDRQSGTATSTLSASETRTLSPRDSGTHGGPTTTTADLLVCDRDRDEDRYEESA